MHAVNSLLRGDLRPLAEYLRAGYPLSYMVRREIVEAIEGTLGDGLYTLKLVKNRRGAGNALTPLHTHFRKMSIGYFIARQIPVLNEDVEAAVHAAMEEFGVSRSTAMEARRYHKEWHEQLAASAAEWKRSNKKLD